MKASDTAADTVLGWTVVAVARVLIQWHIPVLIQCKNKAIY